MYKSKLHEMCQKKKWAPPIYTCVQDGQDHCPQFKASVVVRRLVFQGPGPTWSLKQAYNEAAHTAFLHFTSGPQDTRDKFKKNLNSPECKTDEEGLGLPYMTSRVF